jgi:hypothetical protein
VAVYSIIGWEPDAHEILAQIDWGPELLRNRYIRLWIFHHRHLPAEQLIITLADAVDTAHAHGRDIVLPAVQAGPILPAARVSPAVPKRPKQDRRSGDA